MRDAYGNKTTSVKKNNRFGGIPTDHANKRFGRLTALNIVRTSKWKFKWRCVCDCGIAVDVLPAALVSGNTKSCGCFKKENASKRFTKHGLTESPEYETWCNVKNRCFNPKNNHFHLYGARRITVCRGWMDSSTFIRDMGKRPANHSIDRKDNDGNYSCGHCEECLEKGWPMNCRWATASEQRRNSRQNTFLTYNGKTMPMCDWADEFGLSWGVVRQRIKKLGWTPLQAILTPSSPRGCGHKTKRPF